MTTLFLAGAIVMGLIVIVIAIMAHQDARDRTIRENQRKHLR